MKRLFIIVATMFITATLFAGVSFHSFSGTAQTVRTNQEVEIMNFDLSVTSYCTESYLMSWLTIAAQGINVVEIGDIHITDNGVAVPVQVSQDGVGQVININFVPDLIISGSPYVNHNITIYATSAFPNNNFQFSITGVQVSTNEVFGLPILGNWIHVVEVLGGILYVPQQFPTIQSAIIATQTGEVVSVSPGSYFENIDFIGKQITVTSQFMTNHEQSTIWGTVICGNGTGTIVTFNNNENRDAELIGFHIISGHSDSYGGGIKIDNASPTITACIIDNNTANMGGGGIYVDDGYPRIQNCLIAENSASNGAGMYIAGYVEIVNCSISNNTALTEHISDPMAYGGIYLSSGSNGGSNVIVANSIIWENKKTNYVDQATSNIGFSGYFESSNLTVVYSDIEGGVENIDTQNNGTVTWLDGNIDQSPMFDENYNLQNGSLCINSGYHLFYWNGIQIINLYQNQYNGTNPDMGWWESNYPPTNNNDPTATSVIPVLYDNYPNPFNPETTLSFTIPKSCKVKLEIYNIKGQLVKTLVDNETKNVGTYSVKWNGTNNNNSSVASGTYFYMLSTKEKVQTGKMILMK